MVTIKTKLSILNRIAFIWFALTGKMDITADDWEFIVTDEDGQVVYKQTKT